MSADLVFTISFAVYTLFIVGVGLWSARYASRSDEDYFLAGRSLGAWVAALSASASSESGWVTLGLVGFAFTSGVQAYWIIPGCVLGFLFNWFVIAARLRNRAADLGALTLPDFFSMHFGERAPILRVLSVVVILVAMFLYVAAQFAAAGKAFDASFDGISYGGGVLIGAGVVLIYTVLGGFRAACWTDFVQGLIMVGTLVVFPIYVIATQGGWAFIEFKLAPIDDGAMLQWWPSFDQQGIALLAATLGFLVGSGALGINFGYPGQPHVLVRMMALRDARDARLAGLISSTWGVLVIGGAVTVGLLARAFTEAGDAWTVTMADELAAGAAGAGERGLVLAAKALVPGIFSGMVLAAILAAICSTADSQLVVAASSAASDLYARLVDRSGKAAHTLVNRTTLFLLGVGAVLMVISEEIDVYKYVLQYGWAVLGAAFGPQMILALLWKRATYAGCVAGMATGFLVALSWNWIYDPAKFNDIQIYNLPLAFCLALVVNVVVSLMTGGTKALRHEGTK